MTAYITNRINKYECIHDIFIYEQRMLGYGLVWYMLNCPKYEESTGNGQYKYCFQDYFKYSFNSIRSNLQNKLNDQIPRKLSTFINTYKLCRDIDTVAYALLRYVLIKKTKLSLHHILINAVVIVISNYLSSDIISGNYDTIHPRMIYNELHKW